MTSRMVTLCSSLGATKYQAGDTSIITKDHLRLKRRRLSFSKDSEAGVCMDGNTLWKD